MKKEKEKIVFTVTDGDTNKPIKFCTLLDKDILYDHNKMKNFIKCYNKKHKIKMCKEDLDDCAYNIRHEQYYWHDEHWCYELTEPDINYD